MRAFCVLAALVLPAYCQQVSVLEVDAAGLQHVVSRSKRVVVLMYDGEACGTSHLFQPWLHAIAQRLPSLTFARVDMSNSTGTPAIAEYFGVPAGSKGPIVKAMIRDADPGKRVVNYNGPLEFAPLLKWGTAVLDDYAHEHSSPGYEPPVDEAQRSREEKQRRAKNAMNGLPGAVKDMAETMVKEGRLKRVLEDMGKVRNNQRTARFRCKHAVSNADTPVYNADTPVYRKHALLYRKARPSLTQTRPYVTQTRPSPTQTRPSLARSGPKMEPGTAGI